MLVVHFVDYTIIHIRKDDFHQPDSDLLHLLSMIKEEPKIKR
jgi:hypothetical protein